MSQDCKSSSKIPASGLQTADNLERSCAVREEPSRGSRGSAPRHALRPRVSGLYPQPDIHYNELFTL
jgi:hypothetical protein